MILLGLSACYPIRDDLTEEDLDTAITIYDKSYYTPSGNNKFQNFQTFVVPDTIVHIIEKGVADTITRAYDEYIIDQVRSNLLKLGYIQETNPAIKAPDITVTISVATSTNLEYDWYPYWEWYWPDYEKGASISLSSSTHFYPWVPPYYGFGSIYSYSAGTLVMEMVDVSRIDPSVEKIPVIWAGLVNGATGGPTEGLEDRISEGIDKCFNQSPYLFLN